jgi:hypothetical protein
MRHYTPTLALLAIFFLNLGCAQQERSAQQSDDSSADPVELIQPAPPEVASELVRILDSASEQLPGAAVTMFEAFLAEHHGFETDRLARTEIDHYRSLAIGRYRQARELAREGHFTAAEAILVDVATHLPDTPDGKSALEHLQYEFYINQAQHYLVRQRFAEAEEVARSLRERELTPTQAETVEQILDSVGHVGAALGQVEKQSTMSACRQLMVMLAQQYVEEGTYPSELSMETIASWDDMMSRSIRRSISSIENYRASDNLYSFTVVSSSGNQRIKVVDCEILDSGSR